MRSDRNRFWREAFSIHGSVTPYAAPYVLAFGLIGAAVCALAWLVERTFDVWIGLEVAPYEIAGAALGLLLILRTNAGYDRWWEARKLWGGIVNQSRNMAISALSYGPEDAQWREQFVRWTASFPHIARCSLRGEPPAPEVLALLGGREAAAIATCNHMPSYVARRLAELLREARESGDLDGFGFIQIDKERALLIDHIGACERILKTPLPLVYSIKIRRFITLFLLTIPFALLHRVESVWLIPFVTMLVAYPLLCLDQIGVELQNPFSTANLSHLPLKQICETIEGNVTNLERREKPVEALASTNATATALPEHPQVH
ncbi:MAG: hypothetical protein KF774_08685 [Planctomyces sp.]|nr:hypothetical protein [Planctomyces sp.]